MGNSRKKYGKKFFNGDFHAIHYPMGNSPLHLFLWEIPLFTTPPLWEIPTQYFPYGKSPLFFINPLWEIPTTFFPMGNPHFFYQPLMGNPQKKSGKKNFLRDIWTTVPPKMGVPPGERGHGGIPTPPYGVCGGGTYQDYLLRLLVRVLVRALLVQCAFDFVHSCCQRCNIVIYFCHLLVVEVFVVVVLRQEHIIANRAKK